jgi:hypothetical protein
MALAERCGEVRGYSSTRTSDGLSDRLKLSQQAPVLEREAQAVVPMESRLDQADVSLDHRWSVVGLKYREVECRLKTARDQEGLAARAWEGVHLVGFPRCRNSFRDIFRDSFLNSFLNNSLNSFLEKYQLQHHALTDGRKVDWALPSSECSARLCRRLRAASTLALDAFLAARTRLFRRAIRNFEEML